MKKVLFVFTLCFLSSTTSAQVPEIKSPRNNNTTNKKTTRIGVISISSIPDGCYVKINGEPVGKTPLKIKKENGTFDITFDAVGYESQKKKITVTVGKTVKCHAQLKRIQLSKKDSLLLLADEILGMNSYYIEDFNLNGEGDNIVSFQQNTEKYVRNIKDIYKSSVSKNEGEGMTVDQLKAVITNNILRMQNNSDLESSCTTKALSMISNIEETESSVKLSLESTYSTLFKLVPLSKEQPITKEKTEQIVVLIGQMKLAEAAGIIDDSLNEEKIIERYLLFFRFFKDFYNAGNMRLEELKKEANSK